MGDKGQRMGVWREKGEIRVRGGDREKGEIGR